MTDPQDRRELLPCPFCGGKPSTSSAGGYVWCPDHATSMSRAEWNRRQPSEGREPEGFAAGVEHAAKVAEVHAERLKHTNHRDGLGMGWQAGEELCREIAAFIRVTRPAPTPEPTGKHITVAKDELRPGAPPGCENPGMVDGMEQMCGECVACLDYIAEYWYRVATELGAPTPEPEHCPQCDHDAAYHCTRCGETWYGGNQWPEP
jgi:hypothetical protein